ncbi:aminopeptidase N [Microbacterium dauci]|uniref:Aminopeptidase N n=1 Tax=Microbacterium dauci TaxID=3048008 RepID=A0ABT6ZH10_9MICO|nr:aminopeptidase N [Microbacterium sp. LX3-4]MDJ1115429.1 aminopeptidase N [Microbacterium sp. LX3-4]
MSSANLTRDETAARSAAVRLHTVDVDLDLRSATDAAQSTFATVSTLRFSATTAETWVDFIGDAVDQVSVNGVDVPVEWDGARVLLRGPSAENEVRITARGRFSASGEGLHRFVDPVDDAVYLYTQYEPADCRRVYPCFEQPDMKARWRFRVTAPSEWVVLSNGAELERASIDGGMRVSFAETLPISSYITAVAAGPYHRVGGEWGGVELGILCRASLAEHLDADEILEVTRRGLSYLTEAFGQDYPWGKYDQIFVPEYNLGAMENPGLVTFTEAYVFRGRATRAQREARANTILHEMAHMWFGDLVTMRWWDDLWLKESFADFMGSHTAAAAAGFDDAWVTFASRRKGWAYAQDQLPTTHPIVADIPDLEAAKLNFDGITYAKGASVLKQLVGFVGEDAFFRGAQRYFAEHAFGNTTLEDLLVALERASGRDLRTWSAVWLETTGLPTVSLERATFTVAQDIVRPHRLRLGAYRFDGEVLAPAGGTEFDVVGASTQVDASQLADADLLVLNDDDRSYVKVRLDPRSVDAVDRGLSTLEAPLVRGVVWASLWNATRDGELPASRFLSIVARHAPAETNAALLADVVAQALFTVTHYVPAAGRQSAADAWLAVAWDAMTDAAPASDAQLIWARAVAAASEHSTTKSADIERLLTDAAPKGLVLDPDLRWSFVVAGAATGTAGEDAIAAMLERDGTASGRTAAVAARAAAPDAATRAEAWVRAWNDESLSNDHLDATIRGIRSAGRRDLISAFDDDYFARILPTWRGRSIELAARLVRGLFPATDNTTAVDAWLEANTDAPGALRRILLEQRDHLARDLRVRAAQD